MKYYLIFFLTFVALVGSFAQGPTYALPITFLSSPMNCTDIKFIVDYHNNLRSSLANGSVTGQPQATNLQTIVWDNELMEIAMNYSKKMILAHNPNRTTSRFAVGENLYMTMTTNMKDTRIQWQKAIDAWFNEYKLYTYAPLWNNPATLHYTQLVWADTVYIGCGVTFFKDNKNRLYKLYVCNYGPIGNWFGEFPYSIPDVYDDNTSTYPLLCDSNQCDTMYGDCKS